MNDKLNDKVKILAERIAEEFPGRNIATGDEFNVNAIIIDEFNKNPEDVLAGIGIAFTIPVRVVVQVDDENETYYTLTFQQP